MMELTDRLEIIYSNGQQLFSRTRLRLLLQGILIIFSLTYLISNGKTLLEIISTVHVNTTYLFASVVLTIFGTFLGTISWWILLNTFGNSLSWRISARIHLVSNLAKYIPGFIWQYGGKFILARKYNVPKKKIVTSIVMEMLLLLFVGLGVAISLSPHYSSPQIIGHNIDSELITLVSAGSVIFLLLIPFLLFKILLKNRNREMSAQLKYRRIVYVIVIYVVGWFTLGLVVWLIGRSISPIEVSSYPFFTLATTISFLMGILILFVPGGIGIREGMMVLILKSSFPPSISVLIAVISRLVFTLGEILAYFLFIVLNSIISRKTSTIA